MTRIRKLILVPLVRLFMTALAVAVSVLSSVLWSLEAWLRPLVLVRFDERWMLTAAIGGWVVAAIAWPGNLRRSWRWRAGVAAVMCAACWFGVSIKTHDAAMRMLMGKLNVHYAFHGDSPGKDVQEAMGWTPDRRATHKGGVDRLGCFPILGETWKNPISWRNVSPCPVVAP